MKRIVVLALVLCLLCGCAAEKEVTETAAPTEATAAQTIPQQTLAAEEASPAYPTRFDEITVITLSDGGIQVDGAGETASVYTSRDIIYYADMESYESGNPYGEGEQWERHSAQEADGHTVVNITEPGAYRVTGKLSAGQIRIDLGEDAYEDQNAVVELILSDADITCTVAPAILFMNVYECDGDWSADTATAQVDTAAAGANLILEGENSVTGSHVAKIFKDQEEEKKLWKQDGAVYSYMSMNVYGPGKLDLTADNEGLDTELHLTVNGGDINIRADNDGINTNEDGVSVTTINDGNLHIIAGLGAEGDGIDSNGYLVINGGTVVASANPGADAGMDSNLGSYINGGTVIALGSTMDWAESDSEQVTMNLQFAANQSSDASVVVTGYDGMVLFAYDPSADEVLADNQRVYSGAVVSCANFQVGESYQVYVGAELVGSETGGMYEAATVTGYTGGTQMAYTGTDVRMQPGGMGGMEPPAGFDGERPELPEGMEMGERPEPGEGFQAGEEPPAKPDGQPPEGMELPEGEMPTMPEGMEPGQMPPEGFGGEMGAQGAETGEANTVFYMQDKVNFFSGLTGV